MAAQAWPKFNIPKYSYPDWKYSWMVSAPIITNQTPSYLIPGNWYTSYQSNNVNYSLVLRNSNYFIDNYFINNDFQTQFELDDYYDQWHIINGSLTSMTRPKIG